ncbi:MAG TPA: DUF4345 family protein [Myxococcota bacterium]|nr:DUF4345 family protein [Myxococcota bacterium]
MAQRLPRIAAALLGLLLALPFALRWLLAPESASAEQGIALSGPAALSHMRGDTGGAFFAIGALALLGLWRKEPGYLEAVALVMVCIVAGRLVGIALDGFDPRVGVAMAVELATAAATYAAARQLRLAAEG